MIDIAESIRNIPREVEKRWERYKQPSENPIEQDERKDSYFRAVRVTTEYLLNFLPILHIVISKHLNRGNNNYSSEEHIKKYITEKNKNKKERAFLLGLEVQLDTVADDAQNARSFLGELNLKIRQKIKVLRKIRNTEAHGTLEIDEEGIRDIYRQYNEGVSENESILKMPYITLQALVDIIACEIENNDDLNLDDVQCYVRGQDRSDNVIFHQTGLFCVKMIEEKQDIYIYKETRVTYRANVKRGENEYFHFSTNERIKITDQVGFKDYVEVFLKVIDRELAEEKYVLENEKNITVEIIARQGIPYSFYYKIWDISKDTPRLNGESSENLDISTGNQKTLNLKQLIRQSGLFEIEIGIKRRRHLMTQATVEVVAEERRESPIGLRTEYSDHLMQYEPTDIKLILDNSGNVAKSFKIKFYLTDPNHFDVIDFHEVGNGQCQFDIVEETDQKIYCTNELIINQETRKLILIKIEPIRSERGFYTLGKIELIKPDGSYISDKELTTRIIIEKSYQSKGFYNRTELFNKYKNKIKKEPEHTNIGIDCIWIKGEAGQGKSRIVKRIKKLVEDDGNTCINISFERENYNHKKSLARFYKKVKKEFNKYPNSHSEKLKSIKRLDTVNKIDEIANEFLDVLELLRKDEKTPKKIILQIDDVHFAEFDFLESFLNMIKKYSEMDREEADSETETKKSELTIIFYSRTLDGLGAINDSNQIEIHKLLRRKISNPNQHKLKKITTEDLNNGRIDSEEEMIKEIIEEIFNPHKMEFEIEILKRIMSKKSEANPLILGLLTELMVENDLIIWSCEENGWVLNREEFNLNEPTVVSNIEDFEQNLEDKISDLIHGNRKLNEKLIIHKLENFQEGERGQIINLVGMLESVTEKELDNQGLSLMKYPALLSIVEEKNKVYSFKHQLYKEYWEKYFNENILSCFNQIKNIFVCYKDYEFKSWMKKTTDLIIKGNDIEINFFENNIDKKDVRYLSFSKEKERYFKTKLMSDEDITYENLYITFSSMFKTVKVIENSLLFRNIILNGFNRREELDTSSSMRYCFYASLMDDNLKEEVQQYLRQYTEKDIHRELHTKPFKKNMDFMIKKLIPILKKNKENYLAIGKIYFYYAESLNTSGLYKEAIKMINESIFYFKNYAASASNQRESLDMKWKALSRKGKFLLNMHFLEEAHDLFKNTITEIMNSSEYKNANEEICFIIANLFHGKGDTLRYNNNLKSASDCYYESILHYDKALKSTKKGNYQVNKCNVLCKMSKIYVNYADYDNAIKKLDEAIFIYSTIDFDEGEVKKAILLNNHAVSLRKKSEILFRKNENDKAQQLLDKTVLKIKKAITIYPFEAVFYHNLGKCLENKYDYIAIRDNISIEFLDQAIENYKKCLELNKYRPEYYHSLYSAIRKKIENLFFSNKTSEATQLLNETSRKLDKIQIKFPEFSLENIKKETLELYKYIYGDKFEIEILIVIAERNDIFLYAS